MAKRLGVGGHHQSQSENYTDDWQTPPEILERLGSFSLDPCASEHQKWATAREMWRQSTHGPALLQPWPKDRRIWLNPPYGRTIEPWLQRMAEHGHGTALVFARTDTVWFQRWIFAKAHALLFITPRVSFIRADGTRAEHNSGGPSVLCAYGTDDAWRLKISEIAGRYIRLRSR